MAKKLSPTPAGDLDKQSKQAVKNGEDVEKGGAKSLKDVGADHNGGPGESLTEQRQKEIIDDFAIQIDKEEQSIEKIMAKAKKECEPYKEKIKNLKAEGRKAAGCRTGVLNYFADDIKQKRKKKQSFQNKTPEVQEDIKRILKIDKGGQYIMSFDHLTGK